MGSIHRAAKLALGVTAGLALTLSGTAPAAASSAGTSSTWTLLDVGQRMCVTSTGGHPGAYFFAPVVGTWSKTIQIGIRNMPPGSLSRKGGPIPPGSNDGDLEDGVTIDGFIGAPIAPAPVGVYTPEVWASDGTRTQTVPVTITVKERCW